MRRLLKVQLGWFALLVSGCRFEQPPLGCPVQSVDWAAQYRLLSGEGSCADLPGELWGVVQFFNRETGESALAIQPQALGEIALQAPYDDPDHSPWAAGALPAQSSDNRCAVPQLTVAEKHVEAHADEQGDLIPAEDLVYAIEQVELSAHPRAPGNQLRAELSYHRNGCDARFAVSALWPATACAGDDGEPVDAICQASFPDFPVYCAPELAQCALKDDAVVLPAVNPDVNL